MFVYLDTVEPGDGRLLLENGSHKSSLERPPPLFERYGGGNWPLSSHGVQPEGFAPQSHEGASCPGRQRHSDTALSIS
jgi:hypothetical protein